MTSEEILDKHILKMIEDHKENYNELDKMKKYPEYQHTIDALEEFGKQEYNQALDDAKKLSVVKFMAGESGYLNNESIEILKK